VNLTLPKSCARSAAWAAGIAVSFGLSGAAQAQNVDCTTLPNAVHGIGGSAGTAFIRNLAKALAAAGEETTVVYADTGACDAMTWLVLKPNDGLTKAAKYWNETTGVEGTCTYPSGSKQLADWGSMAQDATTCQGIAALPNTVADWIGPISSMSVVAPVASANQAISADALYYIYGFGPGKGHDVGPFTKPASLASRSTVSAAGLLFALAANLPLSRALYGSNLTDRPQQNVQTNQGAIDYITSEASAVADPDSALGFCSTETVEAGNNRSKVRTLAFQARGQDAAWFPDSTDTASDKKNVREGRYWFWGTHHYFVRTNASGEVLNQRAKSFGEYFSGKRPLPGSKAFFDVVLETNVIPQCAMKVARSKDMGPLSPYSPDEPCGCFFDDKKGFDHGCTACDSADGTKDAACPEEAPVCRHKFCEVK
jgi:hypothetical protein